MKRSKKSNSEWRPRLLVEITPKQYHELQKFFGHNHGARKRVFGVIIDDLLIALEKNAQAVIAGLLERYIKLQDFSPIVREVVEDGDDPRSGDGIPEYGEKGTTPDSYESKGKPEDTKDFDEESREEEYL